MIKRYNRIGLLFLTLVSLVAVLVAPVSTLAEGPADYTVSTVGSIGNQFTPKYNPGDGNFWTMTTAGFDAIGKITPQGVFTLVDPSVGGGGGSSPETVQMLHGRGAKGVLYVADANYGGNWWRYDAATGVKTSIARPWSIPDTSGNVSGMATDRTGTRLYHHIYSNIMELNAVTGAVRVAATNPAFAASSGSPSLWFLEYDGFTDTLIGFGYNPQGQQVLYRINVNTGVTTNIPVPAGLPNISGVIPDASTGLLYAFPSPNPNSTILQIDPVAGSYKQVDLGAGKFSQFSTFAPARNGAGKSLYGMAGTFPNYRVVEIAGPYPFAGPAPTDTTPPVIIPTVTGTTGANGWYTSSVTVSWQVSDPESQVTSIIGGGTTVITEDTLGTTLTCQATSAGGTALLSVTIKRDATPPTIAGSRNPAANAVGWNNSPVMVTFTATDALSGVASVTPAVTVGNDGQNQSVAGIAVDVAGNSALLTVDGINIDRTPPAVVYAGNQGEYTVDQTVNISSAATDSLSGVASSTCQNIAGPAYSFPLGASSFSATATDWAGNTGSGSTTFTVQVTYDSLGNLVRRFVTQQGIVNSMLAKLDNAQKAEAKGNANARAGMIGAFVNEVQAQTGKAVSAENAAILIALAKAL